MKVFPLLFCLVLWPAGFAAAQANQTVDCPAIDVSGGGVVELGAEMSFTVTVTNYDSSRLSYKWTISAGKISEGQGTASIAVTDYKNGEAITANVEVKGLPESCVNSASETGSVIIDYILPTLIDEFGDIQSGEIQNRIDSLYQFKLRNEPNSQGYIINYGSNKEVARRERLIRKSIFLRKYDASRVTFVRGGAKPESKSGAWTKFWLVPPGAMPPPIE
ncbi:MAG TPA: hypothetical protein VIL74_22875 [Pyrinomonadaceae bacterium]|jgi:hypothetical protein